jgi:hypothetical protein
MTDLTPENYFIETGLYQRVPLDSSEADKLLVRIQFHIDPLDAFCVGCRKHSVFRATLEKLPDVGMSGTQEQPAESTDHLLETEYAWLPDSEEERSLLSWQNVIEYARRPKYFTSVFVCSRNSAHQLRFITRVEATSFEKIGQTPSLADLHLGDLARYRGILGNEYTELAKGVGLYAHGIGVGSFVYMRRIFERQIQQAHTEARKDATWDDMEYKSGRVEDRIRLLRDHLPEFLFENRSIYGILSKGIHELSEEECKEYFPVVRGAIEMILDAKLQEVERAKKLKSNQASISAIAGKLKSS